MKKLVAVLLLMGNVAHAGEGKVTLREALRLGMQGNHRLEAAAREAEASRLAVDLSASRYLPRIFLEEAATATDNPTRAFMMKLDQGRLSAADMAVGRLARPGSYTDFRTSIMLEQPLFDLSLGAARDAARAASESSLLMLQRSREETAYRIIEAYVAVKLGRGREQVAAAAVEDAAAHLRVASLRTEAGLGLKSDELRARAYLAEREGELVSAKKMRRMARLRLALLMGLSPGEERDVDEGEPFTFPAGRTDAVAAALSSRADLKQGEAELRRAEAELSRARSAWYPTASLTADYTQNARSAPFGRDNDSWSAGVSLRWELFDGLRRSRDTARGAALRAAAQERLEAERDAVALQVHQALLEREEAEKRLDIARHALADAQESLRLVDTRYRNSLATMVELLDVQAAVDRVREGVAEREAEKALADARVLHESGMLGKEVLQ